MLVIAQAESKRLDEILSSAQMRTIGRTAQGGRTSFILQNTSGKTVYLDIGQSASSSTGLELVDGDVLSWDVNAISNVSIISSDGTANLRLVATITT